MSNASPDAAIGIFDSGVGGLTVARAILDQLPNEPLLYVADTARFPYGPKPIAEVRANALEVLDHLVDEGVKMLVIACNSASSAVLRDARERYRVPVVEVIQPAVRAAVSATSRAALSIAGPASAAPTAARISRNRAPAPPQTTMAWMGEEAARRGEESSDMLGDSIALLATAVTAPRRSGQARQLCFNPPQD